MRRGFAAAVGTHCRHSAIAADMTALSQDVVDSMALRQDHDRCVGVADLKVGVTVGDANRCACVRGGHVSLDRVG